MTAIRIHVNGICVKKTFSLMIVKKRNHRVFFHRKIFVYLCLQSFQSTPLMVREFARNPMTFSKRTPLSSMLIYKLHYVSF